VEAGVGVGKAEAGGEGINCYPYPMAELDQLWRDFETKRDEYLQAQRAFNKAIAELHGNPYPDFDSVTKRRAEQDAAHDAYKVAVDAFLLGNDNPL
jgi:hypothetical protein